MPGPNIAHIDIVWICSISCPPALQTCDSFPQKCLIVHPPCHFDGSLVWLATLPHCFSWFRAGARQSGKQSLALRWGYRQDAFHARCHMVPGHALGTIGKEKSSGEERMLLELPMSSGGRGSSWRTWSHIRSGSHVLDGMWFPSSMEMFL